MRDFLGSRHGRHLGNEVANDVANAPARGNTPKDAIHAAVTRWMNWRLDRLTSRDIPIPAGLPYPTGFAPHFEILAASDA